MKTPYPELTETVKRVQDVIKKEEENFFGTIDAGLARIEKIFADMKAAGQATVQGAEAANLYTTYGVPPELFETMAARTTWPSTGPVSAAMAEHGDKSRTGEKTVMGRPIDAARRRCTDRFPGYETTRRRAKSSRKITGDHLTRSATTRK
jgi:alanyl-tRNA synthetase